VSSVVIKQDGNGRYRFNLIDDDGTVLMTSKGYSSAGAAGADVRTARKLMAEAEVVDQTEERRQPVTPQRTD
jgi:uncharacterized protein YegP (UPF0339 family)